MPYSFHPFLGPMPLARSLLIHCPLRTWACLYELCCLYELISYWAAAVSLWTLFLKPYMCSIALDACAGNDGSKIELHFCLSRYFPVRCMRLWDGEFWFRASEWVWCFLAQGFPWAGVKFWPGVWGHPSNPSCVFPLLSKPYKHPPHGVSGLKFSISGNNSGDNDNRHCWWALIACSKGHNQEGTKS